MYRGDGEAIVAALAVRDVQECPQVAGDALLIAMAQQVAGAGVLATRCAAVLADRDWAGDPELAAQLHAALGTGADVGSLLPEVNVDLEQLADVLGANAAHGGGRLDLRSGEVVPDLGYADDALEYDEGRDDDVDLGRWVRIDPNGARPGYRDMERFIAGCRDRRAAARLATAIDGKSAFARFRREIESWPELENSWHRYSEERRRGRAREWLADAGYHPAVAPRRPAPDRCGTTD